MIFHRLVGMTHGYAVKSGIARYFGHQSVLFCGKIRVFCYVISVGRLAFLVFPFTKGETH